jgi:hypothetical protein
VLSFRVTPTSSPKGIPVRKLLVLAVAAATGAAGIVLAAGPASAARAQHTKVAVVRPVHADGRPVAGYKVTREHISGFTCQDVSPVAVDRNIDFCGFSATYTMACWKSRNHTVLCLRDPWTKELVRIRYSGRFAEHAAPAHPVPQALRLGNGNQCWIRDGGAWPIVTRHPKWFGAYGCDRGDVFGRGDGIQQRFHPWRVHLVVNAGGPHQRISDHRVSKAFFVGTAA